MALEKDPQTVETVCSPLNNDATRRFTIIRAMAREVGGGTYTDKQSKPCIQFLNAAEATMARRAQIDPDVFRRDLEDADIHDEPTELTIYGICDSGNTVSLCVNESRPRTMRREIGKILCRRAGMPPLFTYPKHEFYIPLGNGDAEARQRINDKLFEERVFPLRLQTSGLWFRLPDKSKDGSLIADESKGIRREVNDSEEVASIAFDNLDETLTNIMKEAVRIKHLSVPYLTAKLGISEAEAKTRLVQLVGMGHLRPLAGGAIHKLAV